MRRYYLGILVGLICALLLFTCNEKEAASPFRNIADPQAEYVGMDQCKSCHLPIYNTYMQTGMGQSWGLATKQKSAADFSDRHPPVYDKTLDLYYKAFWKGEDMYIKEYRITAGDTSHYREEKISYVVGSGQHTNSHISNTNGYLHQAPITFYTQKGQWDLAPGFENGHNERFGRKIQTECITCHNGYPQQIEGSLNKYAQIKTGIDCERCHGPGSIHVKEKLSGKIIDTSKGADYSIVNPRRLNTDQQNNLCQRCHLQGIAVLNDEKTFFDFMPSQELKNTMNVFMPTFSGSQKHMIMASHVERMKMSDCFVNSGKMSCISCHNPHISVKATPIETFNTACKNCHGAGDDCTQTQALRAAKKDNCSGCHMAKNESIDIPHVAVTDHYIRKRPTVENEEAIRKFIGLKSYNNSSPNVRTQARAFLEFYERYEPNPLLLDSALHYISLGDTRTGDGDLIRAYFLQNNYMQVTALAGKLKPSDITDAWTAYRIGESYLKTKQTALAILFLQQAKKLMPLGLDFRMKLANALIANKDLSGAKQELAFILKENKKYDAAHQALGFVYLQEQKFVAAAASSRKAIALNPLSEQSFINLAVAYYQQQKLGEAKKVLQKATQFFPRNEQIKLMLRDL